MKIYIVEGFHYSNGGMPMRPFATRAEAQAFAFELVTILWEDIASLIGDEETLPAKIPGTWQAKDWETCLRLAKIARVEMYGTDLTDEQRDDAEELTESAECDVWIEEMEMRAPAVIAEAEELLTDAVNIHIYGDDESIPENDPHIRVIDELRAINGAPPLHWETVPAAVSRIGKEG